MIELIELIAKTPYDTLVPVLRSHPGRESQGLLLPGGGSTTPACEYDRVEPSDVLAPAPVDRKMVISLFPVK